MPFKLQRCWLCASTSSTYLSKRPSIRALATEPQPEILWVQGPS
ncbi:hypothetical protein [Serratia grimesii]|nr:hypothetical protein [Serratia grimesii]